VARYFFHKLTLIKVGTITRIHFTDFQIILYFLALYLEIKKDMLHFLYIKVTFMKHLVKRLDRKKFIKASFIKDFTYKY